MRPKLTAAVWPILLLAIYVCFFWKLLLTDQYTWLEGPDYANQVLPWYQMQAREWHAGRFPLWDPYVWGGQPLLAQAQPGAAYPLNWLLFLSPLKDGFLQRPFVHWYFALIHFQAGLFCYLLCRDLKRTHAASLLSGLAFGLGGFVGTTDWPQMLNGAVWAPLILLYFLRAMRGERAVSSAAWSGAFLGVAFLSGHHQIPIFLGLTMAGLWLYHLIANIGRLKLLLIFGLFAAMVSAAQALPAYEYARTSLRWVGAANPVGWKDRVPYAIHQQYSFYPESIFGVVVPGVFRHSDPFLGLVGLTLALAGLAGAWREREPRLFGAVALGGLVFSLGNNSVFHGVIYALAPLVEKARNPSMAIFIFHFGLCVLIAYGIDSYTSTSEWLQKRITWTLMGFAGALGVLVSVLLLTKTPADDRLGIVVLAGILLAGILTAWSRGQLADASAITLLALLMLFELGNVTTYAYKTQAQGKSLLKELSEHNDIAAFLKEQRLPVLVEIEEKDVAYNFGDWHGVDQFGGYLASMTDNVSRVQGGAKARMAFGTNFYVGRQPIRPDQVEVFTGHSGVKVFRNPAALARVRVVHEGLSAPPLDQCQGPETASMVERLPARIVIDADLKCRGMVIDADTYYPGWVATVDGAPSHIFEAYGFLRGIVVDAGQHRIEIQYRPTSVYLGAGLTLLGLAGATVLGLRSRRI